MTRPMTSGATTCASDHSYAPPAQSSASSMRVDEPMKSREPMGSQAQMYSLSDILGYSMFLGGQ